MTASLDELGLRVGDKVRFRRRAGGRWQEGTVTGLETDGSIGVRDGDGASRALRVSQLEVQSRTARATRWEPVAERAARDEQRRLF